MPQYIYLKADKASKKNKKISVCVLLLFSRLARFVAVRISSLNMKFFEMFLIRMIATDKHR
jgi:hypothetical protein